MSRAFQLMRASGAVALGLATISIHAGLGDEFGPAVALYEERRYSEARELFGELAGARPDDVEVNFYLGRLALWFDEEEAALEHLERAAAIAPSDARVRNALGDAYGLAAQNAPLLAKFDWARKCRTAYEQAVALEPDNPNYRWSLVGYYQLAPRLVGGGMARAYAEAAEMRRLDPMSGRIAFATLCLAEGRAGRAFEQFDEVLDTAPDDFLALYHVGRCAAISGEQLERGLAALRRCLQMTPPQGDGKPTHAYVHHRLGNILEKMGDRIGAEAEYAAARARNPDFRPAKMALKN